MTQKHLYNFGDFLLSVEEKNLRRGDENISLTPKMYDLLLVLVENYDRVLEKEFLLSAVWPDSFVEEGNITFNIRQLRIALGDDAQQPTYIETIPRRGYRFVAKVITVDESNHSESSASGPNPTTGTASKWISTRPVFAVLASLFLVAVMGSVIWYSHPSGARGIPLLSTPFTSEKLSTDGLVFHAVISADGKTMIYTHSSGGNQSVWLRQLETSNNVQIIPPSDTTYGGLAFSPDGGTIYFTRGPRMRTGQLFDLYRVPVVGGIPQKLLERMQGWISLSNDGTKISFVRCNYNDEDYCSLWIADSTDGQNKQRLLSRARPVRIADNKISPDGRKIVFAVGQSRTASNDFALVTVDIQSGNEREVTPEKFFNIKYIVWLPDESGWLVTARRVPDKNYRIWHISAATGVVTILTSDSEMYNRLSIDAKGTLLVATKIDPDFSLNIYKTDGPDSQRKKLANASTVSFAPDGKIAYSSVMTGDNEIWSSNADGSDQRQLTNEPADDFAPIVSPDNKFIYFESNRTGRIQVWRMNIDGTNQTQVTYDEGGFPLNTSPDGQWLYYRSGLYNSLRRVSLQDGREELVYNSTTQDFALSPDTSRIAITQETGGGTAVAIVSLATGQTETTVKSPDPLSRPIYLLWSHDGKYLAMLLQNDAQENRSLWFQDLAGSQARHIGDLKAGEISEVTGLALSYDSKTFAAVEGTWNHNALLIKGLKP